jgi:hypothetical protein
MQEIEIRGLEQIEALEKKLRASPEVLSNAKREAFQAAAQEAKSIVDRHIGGTGKVQSWQGAAVGSRGGYAAVRPKKDTWTEVSKRSGKRYAVGAVTNAIVSGHAFPKPSGRKDYHARIHVGQKVPAKPFYAESYGEVQALAEKTAEQVVEKLISHLEG